MSLQVSRQQAAEELLRRRGARGSLLEFTKYTLPDFQPGEHHTKICDALERVERGECRRLMIFAPPRHTKSELASRRFPAWYLGRNPKKQIIATTYGHGFASDFGRDVRGIVECSEYQKLFNTQLSQDSKSANRWHTSDGGVYIATGVGGQITGRGANLALIDDPLKNRAEADSEIIRDKIWNWYTSTLYTRLMPGGAIVVILTRWHEDDLAGRLLEAQEQGGDQWEVIKLPAISHEGTNKEAALWPEWYDLDVLHGIESVVGPRNWSALYQQEPKPVEGTFFRREWFKRFSEDDLPQNLNIYITSDFAVSGGEGDFTEFGVWGIDANGDNWAVDWWYGQETSDVWIDRLLELIRLHKPLCFFGESGVIKKAVEPYIIKESNNQKTYYRREWVTRTTNKTASAVSFQGMSSSGKINIPYSTWGDRLINQLCDFPTAKYDDAVDVCALFGMIIDQGHNAVLSSNKKHDITDAWGRNRQNKGSSWQTR